MIQPPELKLNLPIEVGNGTISTTTKVWEILLASQCGDLVKVKTFVEECSDLIYSQYNYTPPIHFAVREGHIELVKYLLRNGAHDPGYKTYPFLDSLVTIAQERGYSEIAQILNDYNNEPSAGKYKGDNGEIYYSMTAEEKEFQKAVNHNDQNKAEEILKHHPQFAKNETMSWSEGILMMPSNRKNKEMLELLFSYGAAVPHISKWGRAYYFKHYDIAEFLLEKGMNPNHTTWHHVTLLHDMAQEGSIRKTELLIKYGADINPIEEEYQSTPIGLAARWGQTEMVQYLLKQGADPTKSGASWSTPLAWAKKKGFEHIEKALIQAGAK